MVVVEEKMEAAEVLVQISFMLFPLYILNISKRIWAHSECRGCQVRYNRGEVINVGKGRPK